MFTSLHSYVNKTNGVSSDIFYIFACLSVKTLVYIFSQTDIFCSKGDFLAFIQSERSAAESLWLAGVLHEVRLCVQCTHTHTGVVAH